MTRFIYENERFPLRVRGVVVATFHLVCAIDPEPEGPYVDRIWVGNLGAVGRPLYLQATDPLQHLLSEQIAEMFTAGEIVPPRSPANLPALEKEMT